MEQTEKKRLEEVSKKLRANILMMLTEAGSGHPGGSLSCIDILTYLFLKQMRYDPANPHWPERDRFVLSKGHAAPALYAVLSHVGYYSSNLLKTLRKLGSPLQGHPDSRKLPGVESSTGSLGQGISVAGGMALAAKMDKRPSRVYCLVGDGEIQEGLVWEAAMAIAHFKLDNFCLFVDNNGLQIDGLVDDVMNVYPIGEKFLSFGWQVLNIDGHDFDEIEKALEFFESNQGSGKPTAIVAKTVKGKCVSFMENKAQWHGVAPSRDDLMKALDELGCLESMEEWNAEEN
ncbi:transketolase [Thermospira aquatica]|uniref:Transketolase n=1 Tax=Thermospira aquatica TaxID=2828656 RepID=A0AAX3BBV9_9SPIR|nr:transketolase [Thermospira aquatica]URA09585.1 transketolase [Thermospira aquatica]